MRTSVEGDGNIDAGPSATLALRRNSQLAAMALGDLGGNRQPEARARARRLGREEGVFAACGHFRFDARAVVAHDEGDMLLVGATGNLDVAAGCAGVASVE